jgi:hypothetical protein
MVSLSARYDTSHRLVSWITWDLQLGTWESSCKNVVNDGDTDDDELSADAALRKPSPTPVLPVPEDYSSLQIEEQFVYTKPILIAILNEAYPPARKRHDDFIKGGMARKRVTESACARGTIGPEDVDRLQKQLIYWVLREERRAQKMVDIDCATPDQLVVVSSFVSGAV